VSAADHRVPPRGAPPAGRRVEGIDVARGVAAILMIQGHAFDAFASPWARASPFYAIESAFLQTLALPAFLLLAGASLALRVDAAIRRGEAARSVRAAVVKRGLGIVLVGYGLNAFSAIVDGFEGPETWLRADVLHVIGLSLALLGALGVHGDVAAPRASRLRAAALGVAVVAIGICPIVTPWLETVRGPAGWLLGLVVDIPGVTRMPMVPLAAWLAIGVLLAQWMIASNREVGSSAGAPEGALFAIAGLGLCAWLGFGALTDVMLSFGGVLSRSHPAVIANALDLAGRGAPVLAAGAWLAPRMPARARSWLVRLGQGSMIAYVVHVPLCYGRLGEPWRGQLSLVHCALAALALVGLGWAAVRARDSLRGSLSPLSSPAKSG
jgi:uncharacterized membrane protein